MKKGEIWLINLSPTVGAEISKKRPALIIDEENMGKLPLRVVAPITGWKPHYRLATWMVKVPAGAPSSLDKDSAIDCFQIRSISEKRMISLIGHASREEMEQVEESIGRILGIVPLKNSPLRSVTGEGFT